MRPDRMTTKSREAFQEAGNRAARFGNPELLPEHLLAAMLDQEGGVAAPLLQKAGADMRGLREAVARKTGSVPARERRGGARSVASNARDPAARGGRSQAAQGRLRLRRALRPRAWRRAIARLRRSSSNSAV